MKKSPVLLGSTAVAVLLATSAFAANRGATFTGIGFIQNPGRYAYSAVMNMNPEGTVFMVNPSYLGNYCVEWTREGGWGVEIGAANYLCMISSNGTVMASGVYPPENPLGFPGEESCPLLGLGLGPVPRMRGISFRPTPTIPWVASAAAGCRSLEWAATAITPPG